MKRYNKTLKDLLLLTKELKYDILLLQHNYKNAYYLYKISDVSDFREHQNVVLKPL